MKEVLTILLTATIAPKGNAVFRSDPKARLEDYKKALRFWLTVEDDRIGPLVFAENSGYPLDELAQFADMLPGRRREIEFVGTDMPATPEGLNYGYSEFALVEYANSNSMQLGQRPYFAKVTGRYIFPQISRLLNKLPDDFLIAADCRGQKPWGFAGLPILTVGLILFNREFYLREVASLYQTMVPAPPWTRKQFIEPVLYDALFPRCAERGMILRWPCNCEAKGVGGDGVILDRGRRRLNLAFRAGLRTVWPSLWW